MKCPVCGTEGVAVMYLEHTKTSKAIYKKYQCVSCGTRFNVDIYVGFHNYRPIVEELLKMGKKTSAIKLIRQLTGLDLKTAKIYVDNFLGRGPNVWFGGKIVNPGEYLTMAISPELREKLEGKS